LYKDLIEDWVAGWVPPDDLDQFDSAFVGAIHEAGTQAFPTTSPSFHSHRNHWFYNDRIRELRHRLLIMRKLLRQHPSPDLTAFCAANKHICKAIQEIKTRTCLEWCKSLNVHTSLQDLWRKLNAISGKFKRQPFHPQPKREADALITLFKNRSDTAQLPHSTRQCLATQEPLHDEAISRAIHEPAESGIPLSLKDK